MKQLIWIIFISSVIITSCNDQASPLKYKEQASASVKTGKVMRKKQVSYIKLPGQFFAFEEVSLYPKVSGFIKDISVDRGAYVKKGQVLLQMEAPEIQQQLVSAHSKLAEAEATMNTEKAKYDRLSFAAKTPGSVSPFDLESSKNSYASAQAQVHAEEANVAISQVMNDYLTMTAPFDGVITQRNVHPGAFVGPNSPEKDPLLVLRQTDKLRLTVYVPETYVDKLDLRHEVKFKVNSIAQKTYLGEISRTSQSINERTRSEAIEIDVWDKPEILPGMYAEVQLPVRNGTNAYVIPSSAIISEGDKKFLALVNPEKHIQLVDIQEGVTTGDSTEIFGNLKENDPYLATPDNDIRDGQPAL